MSETRIQALQRMPIFGGMRAEVLEFLLDASELARVAQGKFFFHEHDKAQSMFVLEAGEVAVLKLWEGQQCLLGHLRQGDPASRFGNGPPTVDPSGVFVRWDDRDLP